MVSHRVFQQKIMNELIIMGFQCFTTRCPLVA
jgi:hypothetical protein